jgi:ABC-2 type transport system ATP-binding protein
MMFEVIHVTKKYGKMIANNDLSFSIGSGKIAILLGPNGAGKSTIIKCICGLLRFDGSIRICGYDNRSLEAKKLLGYVPEMPALYSMLTVEEHLEFIARAYSLENWEAYAEDLLDRFELADKRKKLGKELSKGMQQKVSICCALLPRPQVIIFDEPMVGLDPKAIKELKTTFRLLKETGTTLLISTHMIDSVEDYWDVTHIMAKGNILASRTKEDLDQTGESLEELFFSITEVDPEEAPQL